MSDYFRTQYEKCYATDEYIIGDWNQHLFLMI